MTPDRWQRARQIFDAAVELPAGERDEFLREQCSGDAGMSSEIRRMLDADDHTSPLDRSPARTAAARSGFPPVFAAGQVVAGRYRIIRYLSRGGMGEVYESEDLEMNERAALKTLLPAIASDAAMIERFKQEIALARKIPHPNVCRVFDLARHEVAGAAPILFLSMEFLPGQTLEARLEKEGRMSPDTAMPLLEQMAEALDAAHRSGVIHRDFKTSNVMLVPSPEGVRAVVTDFGLARRVATASMSTASLSANVVGTLDYMAPELLSGGIASFSSDVYALGMVAYKMMTGVLPFDADTPLAGAIKRSRQPVPSPRASVPDLDPVWERAILGALEASPAKRYSRTRDFVQAIRGEPVETAKWPVVTKRGLVVALTCLGFLGALGWRFLPRDPSIPLPAEKSMAVLPFRNIGTNAASQAFCEGLTESLTSRLSQLERFDESFSVVPPAEFQGRSIGSVADARRAFGVSLGLTGTVERTGEDLRMVISLIDARTSKTLVSHTLQDRAGHSGALFARAFDDIVTTLKLRLPLESRRAVMAGGTASAGAFELYEEGVGLLHQPGSPQLDGAIAAFQKALRQDPGYALAYAGLGEAYGRKFTLAKDPEFLRQARLNGEQAIALNDRLPSVHLAFGEVQFRTGHLDDAGREFRRTIELNPGSYDAYYWLGRTLDALGKTGEAEQAYQAAVNMRPSYWAVQYGLGVFYSSHGKYPKAELHLRRATELFPENAVLYASLGGVDLAMGLYDAAEAALAKSIAIKGTPSAYSNLGSVYLMQQRFETAVPLLEKAAALSGNDPRIWRNLGDAYRFSGRAHDADPCFRKAIELVQKQLSVDPEDAQALANLALYRAKLGDRSQAEAAIRKALTGTGVSADVRFKASIVHTLTGDTAGAWRELRAALDAGISHEQALKEPELAPLRRDSRFKGWLEGLTPIERGKE